MARHIVTTGMVGTPVAIPVIPDGKEYEVMNNHKRPWRHNDQMYCAECGKSWDIDDPEPPECKQPETNHQRGKRWIKRLKEQLK